MVSFKDVSVVIPAYNEEESIATIIERIWAVSPDFEIVVCSDGSSDATAARAREAGAIVVEHRYNIGNGASVKTGAMASSRPYLLFMDSDGQHPPEDIPKLLDGLPDYDMIIGSRTKRCKTDAVRDIGNIMLRKVAEIIGGQPIMDLTSGFRAVRRDLFFLFSPLYPLRYSYPSTITLALINTGHFVKFLPLDSIVRREVGKSNIHPFKDGLRFLKIIFRLFMLFRPFKIFFPIALALFVFGAILGLYQLVNFQAVHSVSVILLLGSLFFFVNGLLAEQISQIRLSILNQPDPKASRDTRV
ncbi:glycosyltransferase family 2 protein [Solidesulfovibrio sp. C21]|uniref:glycosyltransferase family 2 protein n=1 Tax=Solidesulfovibrio sp. C21 TaxID=3398613 RepID=UPI0039FCA4C9